MRPLVLCDQQIEYWPRKPLPNRQIRFALTMAESSRHADTVCEAEPLQ
jgi:hypothetical protein